MSRRGQGSCPFFSLPPADDATACVYSGRRNCAALVTLTDTGQPLREPCLFVSSHTLRKWLVHSPGTVASLLPSLLLMIV